MARLALFDLDDTLLDREKAFRRWAGQFIETIDFADRSLERLDNADMVLEFLVEADRDGFAPRQAMFEQFKSRFSVAQRVEELVLRYREEYPRAFELDDRVRAGLRALRSDGWRVGIVTNGEYFQEQKLEVTGLINEVDGVCISGVINSWKPEPFIFEEVARLCGADLVGWMVGDSAEADVRGGQRVGLKTIWLQRGRTWDLVSPLPDAQVASVSEAIEMILRSDGGM